MLVHVDPVEAEILDTILSGANVIKVGLPVGYCDGVDFANGAYFYLTLSGANGAERVRVDDCDGSTLRVTRTTNKTFVAGECAIAMLTVDDVKEIIDECKESGAEETTDGTSPNCTDVTEAPESAYLYISLDDDCGSCRRIKISDLMAQFNG